MAENHFDDSYDGRIASLETNQVRFHEDLQRLTRSFSDFDTRMGQKFDQLLQTQSDNQKTPWTNILSATGVMLMLIIAVGSMNNSFVMSSIDNNGQTISEMDKTLQREMRLLDDDLETRIELGRDATTVNIDGIQRRLTVSEQWQDVHDKRVVGLNSGQTHDIARNLLLIEKLEAEINRLRLHQNPTPHTH